MASVNVTTKYGKLRPLELTQAQIDTLLRGQPVRLIGDYVWLTDENFSMVTFDLSADGYTHLETYTLDLREYHIDANPGKPTECRVTFAIINKGKP